MQLKLAVSADGRIAAGNGRPVWVTGEQARRRGHLLRAQADAILVGIGTVLADDPELTCRLPGLAASSPDRIVVDSALRTPVGARVLPRPGDTRPRVWIATVPSAGSAQTAAALAATGADIVDAGGGTDGVDLARLLETLAARGITRVLVEGGHTIGSAFLAADLVDEAVVFQNGRTLGDAGIAVLPDLGLADRARWHREDDVRIEDDVMAVYRRIARFICEDFE